MAITDRILGSKALAALTSPHGVDRYLEMFNPMWAATEVRARVVSIHRENPDAAGSAPVATLTLQPTSTWRGCAFQICSSYAHVYAIALDDDAPPTSVAFT